MNPCLNKFDIVGLKIIKGEYDSSTYGDVQDAIKLYLRNVFSKVIIKEIESIMVYEQIRGWFILSMIVMQNEKIALGKLLTFETEELKKIYSDKTKEDLGSLDTMNRVLINCINSFNTKELLNEEDLDLWNKINANDYLKEEKQI